MADDIISTINYSESSPVYQKIKREFTNKLNDYQEELAFLNKKRNADLNIEKMYLIMSSKINKANLNALKRWIQFSIIKQNL